MKADLPCFSRVEHRCDIGSAILERSNDIKLQAESDQEGNRRVQYHSQIRPSGRTKHEIHLFQDGALPAEWVAVARCTQISPNNACHSLADALAYPQSGQACVEAGDLCMV